MNSIITRRGALGAIASLSAMGGATAALAAGKEMRAAGMPSIDTMVAELRAEFPGPEFDWWLDDLHDELVYHINRQRERLAARSRQAASA